MPQIINSGSSKKPQSKSLNAEDAKKPLLIAGSVVGILVIFYFVYAAFFRPATGGLTAGTEGTVAPPPGYPNTFPYNQKRWQEGKIPVMGGIPPPPSMGGKPPIQMSEPAGSKPATTP